MGILNNLARLTGAREPDHADGGVREWVVVDSLPGRGDGALTFDIVVAGQPAGSAALAVDEAGRPTVRHQTVRFPGGEMQCRPAGQPPHRQGRRRGVYFVLDAIQDEAERRHTHEVLSRAQDGSRTWTCRDS